MKFNPNQITYENQMTGPGTNLMLSHPDFRDYDKESSHLKGCIGDRR
jgi:hypothetical protein